MIGKIIKFFYLKYYNKKMGVQVYSIRISYKLLRQGLGKHVLVGENVQFVGDQQKIGDYTYIMGGWLYNVDVGKYCSIAYDVCIGPGEHNLNRLSSYPILHRACNDEEIVEFEDKRVVIKNDVWIGHGVTILGGVKIGNGVVIGTGAVVTKDIPDYAIAIGVPARVIKYRFDEQTRKKLLQISWWDRSDEWIRAHRNIWVQDVDMDLLNSISESDGDDILEE